VQLLSIFQHEILHNVKQLEIRSVNVVFAP